MTVHDETIAKIRQLPESLVQEVNDFVEFLLMKHNRELLEIAKSDFSDYLTNLSDYQRLLEAMEDKGLVLAMMEVKDETPLNLEQALAELEKE